MYDVDINDIKSCCLANNFVNQQKHKCTQVVSENTIYTYILYVFKQILVEIYIYNDTLHEDLSFSQAKTFKLTFPISGGIPKVNKCL